MNEIEIPRYVDSQHQFFFWELDEVVIIVSIIGLGMALDYLFSSMIPAFLVGWIFSRYKNGNLEGALVHMAYWFGLVGLNKHFPNGQTRRLIP